MSTLGVWGGQTLSGAGKTQGWPCPPGMHRKHNHPPCPRAEMILDAVGVGFPEPTHQQPPRSSVLEPNLNVHSGISLQAEEEGGWG